MLTTDRLRTTHAGDYHPISSPTALGSGELIKVFKYLQALQNIYSKISLLRPFNIKTTSLVRAVFASSKWLLPYNFIFSNKTTPLIGPGFGNTKDGLKKRILLQFISNNAKPVSILNFTQAADFL